MMNVLRGLIVEYITLVFLLLRLRVLVSIIYNKSTLLMILRQSIFLHELRMEVKVETIIMN